MNYYESSKNYYRDKYRGDGRYLNSTIDTIRRSGFSIFPEEEYLTIVETIHLFSDRFDSIYDMGCGSGSLLNFIDTHIGYPIKLFGVDFVEESISLAKKIFPNYYFFCQNVIDFKLHIKSSGKCLILIDPYHYLNEDLRCLIQYYLNINAKIVLYTYSDVLTGLDYNTIFDFEIFKKYKVSFGIIKKTINTAVLSSNI